MEQPSSTTCHEELASKHIGTPAGFSSEAGQLRVGRQALPQCDESMKKNKSQPAQQAGRRPCLYAPPEAILGHHAWRKIAAAPVRVSARRGDPSVDPPFIVMAAMAERSVGGRVPATSARRP